MSQSATEGGQGQESGTPNGTGQGQESGQGAGQGQESGQQGTTSNQQGQQGQQDQGIDLSTIQDPTVRAYLEKVQKDAQEARQEAARYRTERNSLTEQVQTFQRQNETDQDRQAREAQEAAQRLEALERENRELKVGTAIQTAAADAKAFNPGLIANMLGPKIELGDDGTPTNLQDLLKELRQSDPYLFKRADNNGGEGTGQQGQPAGSMNDLIRGQVAARRGRST